MNPTTLNLLAVSVFAFTLLSLVGPLLNISPGAVAVVLSACVGLLALDRYGWQGKGGNLLVDLVSGQSSEYRQRIVHHEAGHFLIAHMLNIPVESYTLSAWQGIKAGLPGLGGVIVDTSAIAASLQPAPQAPAETLPEAPAEAPPEAPPASHPLTAQILNHYSILWMAGIAAEQQKFGDAQGGDDDKAQLRRLWELAPAQNRTAAAPQTQMRWALLQANTLLENQPKAYQALVTAMGEQRSVEDCCVQIEANLVEANLTDINTKNGSTYSPIT